MTRSFDIAVLGASLGGVRAARAACSRGLRVYLCEETRWIGGQLTSQAVPPDEHPWIEEQGAPRSYLDFRRAVREAFLRDPELTDAARAERDINPGSAWVSRLAHDPRISLRLLEASLADFIASGLLTLETETRCTAAETAGDRVTAVLVERAGGIRERIEAAFFLDATDTGELLPLTGTEYRAGAEGREETGEPHAPEIPDPEDQQPVTWVAALELTKEREPMEKPAGYEDFRRRIVRGVPQLGWEAVGAHGLTRFAMMDNTPGAFPSGLWTYRRIQDPSRFRVPRPEISLLNWPQNDYVFGGILDSPRAAEHLEEARLLTRCCAWWLWEQGWPVRLRGDVVGTEDGLAMAPYIRESRRIVARKTMTEQEIAKNYAPFPLRRRDSIGVGHYAIDLHVTTRSRTAFFEETHPFEIPLGALIPVRMRNLLPACKNIGATHLTGGCFREHPVEWSIGEAAGFLAAFCLKTGLEPAETAEKALPEFQTLLESEGFQLHWREPAVNPKETETEGEAT